MKKEGSDQLSTGGWFFQEENQIDLGLKRMELENQRFELEIKRRRFESQERILTITTWVFVGAIIFTCVIFVFQGFRVWGFNLDTSVLIRLGDATIGAVVGLLGIIIRAIFGLRQERSQTDNQTAKE